MLNAPELDLQGLLREPLSEIGKTNRTMLRRNDDVPEMGRRRLKITTQSVKYYTVCESNLFLTAVKLIARLLQPR